MYASEEELRSAIVPSKKFVPTSPKDYARAVNRLRESYSDEEIASRTNKTVEDIVRLAGPRKDS